jgi:hypothetical protein
LPRSGAADASPALRPEQVFDRRDDPDLLVDLARFADPRRGVARQDLEDALGSAPDAGKRAVDIGRELLGGRARMTVASASICGLIAFRPVNT